MTFVPVTRRSFLTIMMALSAGCGSALAGPKNDAKPVRHVLVIGNSTYREIAPLANPVNDATLIGNTFKEMGYLVTVVTDATRVQMLSALQEFGKRIVEGRDIGVIYYAGHGISYQNEGFLLPVDTSPKLLVRDGEPQDLGDILVGADTLIEPLKRTKVGVLIMDACRNVPRGMFAAKKNSPTGVEVVATASDGKTYRSVDIDQGVNAINAKSSERITNLVTILATARNQPADDGEQGTNSPFARSFAKHVKLGGPHYEVMNRVTGEVGKLTDGKQAPWMESSLKENFYFLPPNALPGNTGPIEAGPAKPPAAQQPKAAANRPQPASRPSGGSLPPGVGVGGGAGLF